jgi:CHAD domain-containing protein
MNVDIEKATRPLRKLRKLLKDLPSHPSPEEVHDLRTRARRLEAIVHALSPDPDRDARRLVKLIKPVRKIAGQVRDMDVFISKLHALTDTPAGEALVRLTEHLAGVRSKHATRLHRQVARSGKQLCRSIKRYAQTIESSGEIASPAAPQMLAAQLDNWPKLHKDNLHEFRKHAKQLRYILQLVPGVDQQRMTALTEAKDAAGEWHDWLELRGIAEEVLDPDTDRQVLQQIAAIAREKLRAALTAANRLRKLSLDIPQAA